MTHLNIHLPYFKQGSDLNYFLETCENNAIGLKAHAEMLKEAANILLKIAEIKDINGAEFHADTHYIGIETNSHDIASSLLCNDLAQIEEIE